MASSADIIDEFARRMGMTNSAAEDLLRSLRNASDGADRAANAFDVSSAAASRLSNTQQQLITTGSQLSSSLKQSAQSLARVPEQIATAANPTAAVTSIVDTVTSLTAAATQGAAEISGTAIGSAFGPLGALVGREIGKMFGNITATGLQLQGSVINFFLRGAQNVIDSFTQLSSVGITFAGSLENMREMSKQTGLSFETLSKIAVDNAQNLAILGGGTQGALKIVTNTTNALGNTLLALYGGFSNLNAEVADYMAARRRQGVSEMATDAQLVKQTGDYLYMMKELSALTGKSAKIVRTEIEQRMKNAATQLAIDEMTETERKNFEYQLGLLPDALRGVYADLVVAQKTGNTAVLAEGLKMGATMPGIYNKLENMVSSLSMSPDEMKKRFGQEASGLVEETKNYRREFKDQLYLFSAGRVSSDVVRNIDTVLTNLGENLGRLKTLPADIKTFGDQIGILKTNSQNFTEQIGLINKEQENIRIALNDMVTEGERFNFTLKVTTTALEMTKGLINVINDLIPKFISNKPMTMEEADRLTADKLSSINAQTTATLRNLMSQYQTRLTSERTVLETLQAKQEKETDPAKKERIAAQITSQQQQIERYEKLINQYKTELERRQAQNQSSSSSAPAEQSSENSTTTRQGVSMTRDENQIKLAFNNLSDKLLPLMEQQNSTMIALERTLDNQAGQLKRVMDRVG